MANKRLLVITGVQKDFFKEPFGSTRMSNILPKIADYVQNWDGDIIVLKETRLTKELLELGHGTIPGLKPYDEMREYLNVGYAKHCIKWTDGWELVPELLDVLKTKNEKKCTFRTVEAYGQTWHDWGNNIAAYDEIVIAGTKLEDQILSTVFAILAVSPNMKIRIPLPLCTSEYGSDFQKASSILENRALLTWTA